MRLAVVSWNILADAYIRRSYYPRSAPAALAAAPRRALLVRRIGELTTDADVLCLQEVERPAFVAIEAALGDAFTGRWMRKGAGKPDGCATFVRRAHAIDAVEELRYSDRSEHVALIVRVGGVRIANTHIKWDQPDTAAADRYALRQTAELLAALREPAIACGDFNVIDSDEVVTRILAAGYRDAHATGGAPTCVTNGRARRIDYLFATAGLTATPMAVTPLVDELAVPSETEPSDHVPVGAVFE